MSDYTTFDGPAIPAQDRISLKIVVAGGFGVGKTTLVGSLSEIEPLRTEVLMTVASDGVDSLNGIETKRTTTAALDFGRITMDKPLSMVLYLFGTPGQDRFQHTWDDLSLNAIGAVVLADTSRIEGSFDAVDFFEQRGIPFVLAVNEFANAPNRYTTDEVRAALELPPHVPVILCDARNRGSALAVLKNLIIHALDRLPDGASR